MTTTLRDHRPVKASRSSCGFCEGGHDQAPGKCYDDHGRGNGTCYGAVPALNPGRGNGHAAPGEGLSDSGGAVGQPPAAGAQAVPERYAHRLGDLSPHPRRQVIPYARYDVPPGSRFGRALVRRGPCAGPRTRHSRGRILRHKRAGEPAQRQQEGRYRPR